MSTAFFSPHFVSKVQTPSFSTIFKPKNNPLLQIRLEDVFTDTDFLEYYNKEKKNNMDFFFIWRRAKKISEIIYFYELFSSFKKYFFTKIH